MMHPLVLHRRSALLLLCALATLASGCRDSLISPEDVDPRSSVGEVTTENCEGSAEGGYICDPISGGGGSEPPPDKDPGDCNINTGANCDNFPGSGGGGDGGGGGGTGGDDPAYDDSPPADDSEFDCHLAATPCTLTPASDTQKTAMRTAIQKHINQSKCPQVYDTALGLVESSQVWEEKFTDGGATYRGDYLREKNEMHLWTGNFASPDKWLPWTIAHESVHALQFELGFTMHSQIHSYGDSCLNFSI